MFKSQVLFSLALGGLVLAGCNKDENPTPVAVPAATTTSTTMPTTDIVVPAVTLPTSVPAPVGAAIDGAEKKATDIVGDAKKSLPTSLPSLDSK